MMITTDFKELLRAFNAFGLSRGEVNDLYDVWKLGAPTPDSIIRDPKHFNPEHDNTVKRVIPTEWLRPVLKNLADKRGINLTEELAEAILYGGR